MMMLFLFVQTLVTLEKEDDNFAEYQNSHAGFYC